MLDSLTRRVALRPDSPVYRFLPDGEVTGAQTTLTWAGLDDRVRDVAGLLARHTVPGDRALLRYPSGLDFVVAFLACQRAGVIAVPVPESRIDDIAADCRPAVLLTAGTPPRTALRTLDTTDPGPSALGTGPVPARGEDIAFLQYAAKGVPRGVVVTHANLIYNLRCQQMAWRLKSTGHVVSWLPPDDCAGLVAGLLYPLFAGASCTFMPPQAFLRRPARWLEAISAFGATLSIAPGAAYELAARQVSDAERAALDLSRWHSAVVGPEPVRPETLDRFVERFAAAGFARTALSPAYGLAESTLLVTATPPGRGPRMTAWGMSSGSPVLETAVLIVDPDSGHLVADGEAGEIWVRSASNSPGYWNRPADRFRARFAADDSFWLRTGESGVWADGGLVVGGRLDAPTAEERPAERAEGGCG